jgi:hypothetical protein
VPLQPLRSLIVLQRLTAQSKQRARMWTSQSLNVRVTSQALGYTEPEAPGDREHARGRLSYSKHNDLSVRDVAATCFDVSVLQKC